jgi:uncharacterized protein (TIGR00369 family)
VADTAPRETAPATDEALLARFQASRSQPASSRTVGLRITAVDQALRQVEADFDASADIVGNPMKQVQGGYLCVMLDEVMSIACMVASGMTSVAPTLEMKTSFYRPATPGPLRGIGRVVRWGKTIAFTEGEIFDPEGRLVAKATGTALPTPYSNYKPKAPPPTGEHR